MNEGDREQFDQTMPTKQTIMPSIYGWKRSVLPPNPESILEIEHNNQFFTLKNGENICKYVSEVNGDPRRRVMVLTSSKVMKICLTMGRSGVMDATFDSSPNLFSQLFMMTIHLLGIVWRPMVYIFMTDKYEDSYQVAFDMVKETHFGECFQISL